MADRSDWYTKEDPTTCVLVEILRDRAQATPGHPYLKYVVGCGGANARANRVANGLTARGVRPGESVSVMLPNHEGTRS